MGLKCKAKVKHCKPFRFPPFLPSISLNLPLHRLSLHILSTLSLYHFVSFPLEALAIHTPDASLQNDLLINTISCLMNPEIYLVSDEIIFKNFLGQEAKIATTETFIYLTEGREFANLYSRFMLDCKFIGVYVEPKIIVDEYLKQEKGEDNIFQDIIQNGIRNPFQLFAGIDAGLIAAQKTSDPEFLRIAFTSLFTMIFKGINIEFLKSDDWMNLLEGLTIPCSNCILIKECLLQAQKNI